jgi:hypothetical protein
VTYVYDDVTYVYDDVTYVYDDVTYVLIIWSPCLQEDDYMTPWQVVHVCGVRVFLSCWFSCGTNNKKK